MNKEITLNKQGQTLGRKGLESRAKLMSAARRLLETHSPVEVTAVAIAAEAGTSPASFYMYFDDTKDILYALSEVAGEAMMAIHSIFDEPWSDDNLEQRAAEVVQAITEVWSEHRQVLRFRNMEADRGDPRFEALRMNTYIPFIERFAQRILTINPAGENRRRADAYAEATIFHAAMERLSATEPEVMERGLGQKRMNAAVARLICLTLRSGNFNKAAGACGASRPAAKPTARLEPVATAKLAASKAPVRKSAVKPAAKPAVKASATRRTKAAA